MIKSFSLSLNTPLGEMLAISTARGICLLAFTDVPAFDKERTRIQFYLKQNSISQSKTGIGALSDVEQAFYARQFLQQLQLELMQYFQAQRQVFSVPLDLYGTDFQQQVWATLRSIPYGQTCSYQFLAEQIHRPLAMRAVAAANASNPVSILVPCHRVIGKNGKLVGYSGGLWRKKHLLIGEKSNLGLLE